MVQIFIDHSEYLSSSLPSKGMQPCLPPITNKWNNQFSANDVPFLLCLLMEFLNIFGVIPFIKATVAPEYNCSSFGLF